MHVLRLCVSQREQRMSSFSLLISLNLFVKHHANPKFMITCCLREALSECVLVYVSQRKDCIEFFTNAYCS